MQLAKNCGKVAQRASVSEPQGTLQLFNLALLFRMLLIDCELNGATFPKCGGFGKAALRQGYSGFTGMQMSTMNLWSGWALYSL